VTEHRSQSNLNRIH